MSNKDTEIAIMDRTKSLEEENSELREEISKLRQQLIRVYRAWTSGLSPPPFPSIDPANTSSFPPMSQAQFSTFVDAPQYASKSTPRQYHPNTSHTHFPASQCKSSTFPPPPTEAPTLTICPTVGFPLFASEPVFNTLDNHCYIPEPRFKLTKPPKFLPDTKKSGITKEQEEMAREMKSLEQTMKNPSGRVGHGSISYKNLGISSTVNLPPSLKMSESEKHDGHDDPAAHLTRHHSQLRNDGGKKKKNDVVIVVPGPQQNSRGSTYQYRQPSPQVYTPNPHTRPQQNSSVQNPKYFIPLPQYPLCQAQPYAHPSAYPQWHAPIPQNRPPPSQTYKGTSKSNFQPRPEYARSRKIKDSFTPIGESYTSLFQKLRQWGMITPLPGYTPDPRSRSFDPTERCAFHSYAQGHSTEDCRTLKREIERMIQEKLIVVQHINTTSVIRNPSPTHGNEQFVGIDELVMGTQNLFAEENVCDNGEGSSHVDMQIGG